MKCGAVYQQEQEAMGQVYHITNTLLYILRLTTSQETHLNIFYLFFITGWLASKYYVYDLCSNIIRMAEPFASKATCRFMQGTNAMSWDNS
jgi:hypothetical protein